MLSIDTHHNNSDGESLDETNPADWACRACSEPLRDAVVEHDVDDDLDEDEHRHDSRFVQLTMWVVSLIAERVGDVGGQLTGKGLHAA